MVPGIGVDAQGSAQKLMMAIASEAWPLRLPKRSTSRQETITTVADTPRTQDRRQHPLATASRAVQHQAGIRMDHQQAAIANTFVTARRDAGRATGEPPAQRDAQADARVSRHATANTAVNPRSATNLVAPVPSPAMRFSGDEGRRVGEAAVTMDSAFSGVVIDDATPSAVGANIAAPRPARARLRSTVFRSEANALMALPTKMASALTSRACAAILPDRVITGAMMANDSAYGDHQLAR